MTRIALRIEFIASSDPYDMLRKFELPRSEKIINGLFRLRNHDTLSVLNARMKGE
jgi:hypothetical protein